MYLFQDFTKDLLTKKFIAQCTLLKRKLPGDNYIMSPYDGKHNINEIYKRIKIFDR